MYTCFSDLFGNYLYDSIKNDIIEISNEMYDYLTKKNLKYNHNDELKNLIKNGFLSDKEHKIEYPILDFKESLFTRSLSNVTIQVTQNCNFRCEYCAFTDNNGITRTHNSKKMNWTTMKKSIDFIHNISIDSNQITIGFYGGEPFLETELLKRAISYSNNLFIGKSILYAITTNASLLTDDILNYLNNYNVSLTISLDGPKHINDIYRKSNHLEKSSYEYAKNAIKSIVNNYKNLAKYLTINMVLIPQHDFKDYLSILDEIPELKDIKIISGLVSNDGLNIDFKATDKFISGMEYSNFINRLIRFNNNQDEEILRISKFSHSAFQQTIGHLKTMIATGRKNSSPSGPCIPIHNKLFIDINGNFLPCEKVSENIEDLKFGNIYDGINFIKLENIIQIPKLTSNECKKCWAYNLCSSCVKYCVDDKSISKKSRLKFCDEVKFAAKNMLYEYASIKREKSLIYKGKEQHE